MLFSKKLILSTIFLFNCFVIMGQSLDIQGHRGCRGLLPENTIEGFEFTLKIGVRALEFDVVLTQDAKPVITHNHHLLNAATRAADGG